MIADADTNFEKYLQMIKKKNTMPTAFAMALLRPMTSLPQPPLSAEVRLRWSRKLTSRCS